MSILLRMYPGDAWAFFAANVLVQVTVVILTAWFLSRLCSRWNAAWRHSIYLVALVCALASPALSWAMRAAGISLVTWRTSAPTALPAEPARLSITDIHESSANERPTARRFTESPAHRTAENSGRGLPSEIPPAHSFPDFLRALGGAAVLIWLLGIALFAARWFYGLHLIAVLRRRSQSLECAAMTDLLRHVRHALGAGKLPPMATSSDLDRPIMIGLIHPLVILPEDVLRTLREPELADILIHECAHAVRRHQMVGLLQRVAEMLFWPHPLIHWLNRALARAREEVCDNYVLQRRDAPRYARTLLELSQLLVGVSPKPTALGLFHCPWRLEDRVADLLDKRRSAMIRVNRWTAAALTAAFLLLVLLVAGMRVLPAASAADQKTGEHVAVSAVPSNLADQSPLATNDTNTESRKPVVGRNFVVVPFTTELQRAESLSYGKANTYLLLNGTAMMNDEDTILDLGAVDFKSLDNTMQAYIRDRTLGRVIVEAHSRNNPKPTPTCATGSAYWGLTNLLRTVPPTDDFDSAITRRHHDLDWSAIVADLSKPATEEEMRFESGVGDELVKVYPIRTPLSQFFFGGNGENCVIRNMKPLDQFTPEDVQAFRERAKTYIAKLSLQQTPKLVFLFNYGNSCSKSNRVSEELHRDDDAWWKAQGYDPYCRMLWDSGPCPSPKLLVKVVDGEKGTVVPDAKLSADYPEESRKYLAPGNRTIGFTKEGGGRWCSVFLMGSEDFTLTVQAPGYKSYTEKLNLPKGATKELEVKLQTE